MRPVLKAGMAGAATVIAYLAIVALTTPALEPQDAIRAALYLNSPIIFGMGAGIGIQVVLSEKARMLGCGIGARKKTAGINTSGAAASFFSFFSLVPLGCCGWWLYVLSLLPSVVGTGASAVLIEYSVPLSYAGLGAVFALNAVAALRLRAARKEGRIRTAPEA